jgi:PHP family Zn ribbon phosphoesterase
MMLKTIGLVAALVLGSAVPALADSSCAEPIAPAALDGGTATKAQMSSAHDDVMTFLKQSDDYQVCVLREFHQAQTDATKAKQPIDPALAPAADAKIKANQGLKEKVGGEYNAAVNAYKAKHPGG